MQLGTFNTAEEASAAYLSRKCEIEKDLRAREGIVWVSSEKTEGSDSPSSVLKITASDSSDESGGGGAAMREDVLGEPPEQKIGFLCGVQIVDLNFLGKPTYQGMISLIQDSTMSLGESWRSLVKEDGGLAEIKIDQYMRSFSGDVISKACFGSNYSKGEEIFLKLRALQEVSSKKLFAAGIGMRFLMGEFSKLDDLNISTADDDVVLLS